MNWACDGLQGAGELGACRGVAHHVLEVAQHHLAQPSALFEGRIDGVGIFRGGRAVAQHDDAVVVLHRAGAGEVEAGALREPDGHQVLDAVAAQVVVDVGLVEARPLPLGEVGLVGQGPDGGRVLRLHGGARRGPAPCGFRIAPAGAVDLALDAAGLVAQGEVVVDVDHVHAGRAGGRQGRGDPLLHLLVGAAVAVDDHEGGALQLQVQGAVDVSVPLRLAPVVTGAAVPAHRQGQDRHWKTTGGGEFGGQ